MQPSEGGDGATVDRDCSDFSSQQQAQSVLDQDRSDPDNLDANNNGIACEDYFSSSQPTVTGNGGPVALPATAVSGNPNFAG